MTTEKKPLVTVVMPCFNEERSVVRALRSLFDEWSIKACEFLVVDGGSTDRTRAAVEELIRSLREDPPINPPYPPFNKGGNQPPFSNGGSFNAPPLPKGGTGGICLPAGAMNSFRRPGTGWTTTCSGSRHRAGPGSASPARADPATGTRPSAGGGGRSSASSTTPSGTLPGA